MSDVTVPATAPGAQLNRPLEPPRRVRAWIRRSPLAAAGLLVLGFFVLLAVLAPWIMPYNPVAADAAAVVRPPSAAHWFGTDANGMDVLSRVIYGSVYAFEIALPAVALAIAVGVPIGLVSGYVGGWTDEVLMRCFDALRVFPSIILALAVVSAAGASVLNVVLASGFSGRAGVRAPGPVGGARATLRLARGVRGRGRQSRLARVVLGVHLMPNTLQRCMLAQAAIRASWAVRLSTTFAFLRAGDSSRPTPEWGAMIRQEAEYMVTGQWWIGVFPGIALILLCLGLNTLAGDGLATTCWTRDRRGAA